MLTTLLKLALAVTTLTAAEAPDLECLSDVSIEGLWQGPNRPYIHNDEWLIGPMIVLVGAHDDPDPDGTWGIWNEPEIKSYIDQEQFTVIYMQDDEPWAQQILNMLGRGFTTPCMLFRDKPGEYGSARWNALFWPAQEPDAADLIEWIKDTERKRSDVDQSYRLLSERLEQDATNIKLRFELIVHCQALGGYPAMAHRFVPWLLLNHDKWYEYENDSREYELSEEQFHAIVFERIRLAREALELFGHETQYSKNYQVPKQFLVIKFDSWIDRVERERTGFWSGVVMPEKGMQWQWSRTFKPYAAAVTAGDGTDRDRFILHALTAEDDDWQALIEQYSYDYP